MEEETRKLYSRRQQKSHWQERVAQKRSYDAEWDFLLNQAGETAKRRRRSMPSPKSFNPIEEMYSPFSEITSKLTSEQIVDSLRKEIKSLHRSRSLSFDANCSSGCSLSSIGSNLTASSCVHQSLFSYKQIELICERMLKVREKEMRAECDRIFNDKLAEQHDMFVKFTFDAIQKRNDNCIPSYFS